MITAVNMAGRILIAVTTLSSTAFQAQTGISLTISDKIGTLAAGQFESVFDGRWRPDGSSMQTNAKPTVLILRDGLFRKGEEAEADVIPADGRLHPVHDNEYIDQVSITVIGDRSVREIDMLRGKVVYSVEYTVSPDGKTASWQVANQANPNGSVARSETRQRRIQPSPSGSHSISGTWQQTGITVDGGSGDWLLSLKQDRFSSWSPQGVGFEAVIDGPPVAVTGDVSGGMVTITSPSPRTIVKRSMLRGRVGSILEMTVLDDGKTMRVVAQAPQRGVTSTFYLLKQ
ncbi:hypothetical protein GCM10022268_30700 [Sphingomonas cynarae]|uniref:Uncharacterized protein n=1 Tax=Sphingomonas cynarae TaxID=930197 RepID=A0ABP7ELZ5_9SPHN